MFSKRSPILFALLTSACMSSVEQHLFDVQPAINGNPNDVNATYEIDIKRREDTYSVYANYFLSDYNQRRDFFAFTEIEKLDNIRPVTTGANSNFIRCELNQINNKANVHASVTVSDASGNILYAYHHCVPHLRHWDQQSLSVALLPFPREYFTLKKGRYKISVHIKNADNVVYPKYDKLQIEISNLYKSK